MFFNALGCYVRSSPREQNALDIFKGEWTSILPAPFSELNAGSLDLFQDSRITWALQEFGDIKGKDVLELGPLEGGHSYMLEKAGAQSVLAIESNTKAYLRCLIVKEILELKKVRYRCGDFTEYLRNTDQWFPLVLACGVLYHTLDPMSVIADIARICSTVFIWTHYYEKSLVSRLPEISNRFGPAEEKSLGGLQYSQHRFHYEHALALNGFCGGSSPHAYWLSRDSLLAGLQHYGFANISINFDAPEHPNGPALALVAKK